MRADSARALSRFLARLADGHLDPDTVFCLRLAETGLEGLQSPPAAPGIAVIGPTQTGKSTVVNVLAGGPYVEVSALAAHTRRPFVLAVNTDLETGCPAAAGLEVRSLAVQAEEPSRLIWDTPDFDSNASAVYRQHVARVCALADMVVVVLSKEKYADQSVWRVMETIAPLQVPMVVCLNKCENQETDGSGTGEGASDAGVLVPALEQRIADNPEIRTGTPVFTLPAVPGGDLSALLPRPDVQSFRKRMLDRLAPRDAAQRQLDLGRLVVRNWDKWTAPVDRELARHEEWKKLLDEHAGSFVSRYQAEYIDHARHHDVARKAILGLLELLEIPALAGPISRTRRMLTWPFRKLSRAYSEHDGTVHDQELDIIQAAFEHSLLSLRGRVLGHREAWWHALGEELSACESGVRRRFHDSVARYREAFQPRIDELSEELYRQLEHNPMTLNALRATRLSADAGGVVLAIKTGTLGLYDALFAPAVVSLTSYLTESVVGGYLQNVIGRLKREQVEQVAAIMRHEVVLPLSDLHPSGPGLFGVTAAELAAARERKTELAS